VVRAEDEAEDLDKVDEEVGFYHVCVEDGIRWRWFMGRELGSLTWRMQLNCKRERNSSLLDRCGVEI
jgi:hypothetical protein